MKDEIKSHAIFAEVCRLEGEAEAFAAQENDDDLKRLVVALADARTAIAHYIAERIDLEEIGRRRVS